MIRCQNDFDRGVLAVGSGPFLLSLVAALSASGLFGIIRVLVTDQAPTDRQQLAQLLEYIREREHGADIAEIFVRQKETSLWQEAVRPFPIVLYVSQEGNVEELRALQAVCREEGKIFLPAICIGMAGLAGPLVQPESAGCWESAWRSIHKSALGQDSSPQPNFSAVCALLANVLVHELLGKVAGAAESDRQHRFYLLDLETLAGSWHAFIPHPLETGNMAVDWVEDINQRFEHNSGKPTDLFPYFNRLTSAKSGIFHVWEEGGLQQLPLAQCLVQPADPLSEGPARLLPEIVCAGMTHEGARREAGLAGIEAYVSRLSGRFVERCGSVGEREFVGIGAGETFAESVSRGLQKCLAEELRNRRANRDPAVTRLELGVIDDERCLFFLRALTTLQGPPVIGSGAELSGFPVIWIGAGGRWFGSTGLNATMALRMALQQALQTMQNKDAFPMPDEIAVSSVNLVDGKPPLLAIPSGKQAAHSEIIRSALRTLERNRREIKVFELVVEPFLPQEPVGVFGVLLQGRD